ncbi:MAG: DUF4332 domain-containing protein [Anaerolineales bacterium]|nr:DUF4332 domain-containing protein [Anaerolineales bacterium]
MTELFSPDLSLISLDEFFESMKQKTMLPGRIALQENAGQLFLILNREGLRTMADLYDKLKTQKRVESLAALTGLDRELLILLRREALSWLPKPIPLNSLPDLEKGPAAALEVQAIKNTKDLFEHLQEAGSLENLAQGTGVDPSTLRKLLGLADLSRVNGIGPAFLRMLAETGIGSVRQFLALEPEELIQALEKEAKVRGEKRPPLSAEDMEYCLWYARRLPEIDSFL